MTMAKDSSRTLGAIEAKSVGIFIREILKICA